MKTQMRSSKKPQKGFQGQHTLSNIHMLSGTNHNSLQRYFILKKKFSPATGDQVGRGGKEGKRLKS